jgi:hypothetical protein
MSPTALAAASMTAPALLRSQHDDDIVRRPAGDLLTFVAVARHDEIDRVAMSVSANAFGGDRSISSAALFARVSA